jgi:hypothetical protein
MSAGYRVTIEDLQTGVSTTRKVEAGDYILLTSYPCRLAGEQRYANGTRVLTIKDWSPGGRKTRYVVCGNVPDVEAWRRERGLSRRDVIAQSTTSRHTLRGLSGSFEVVELPSWASASEPVRAEVERNLAIARLAETAGGQE